jgi:tRNA threonylcarbamoyladenosine biosynthesis protein TsaB
VILALDTSTDQGSVAISTDAGPLAEFSWTARGNHSQLLDRAFKAVLAQTALRPSDIRSIAVATGPGSFNGLRVGISYAKGLAFGLSVPLIGVPTLDLIAFQARSVDQRVWAVIDAGRGELYYAAYVNCEGSSSAPGEPRRASVEALVGLLSAGDRLAGPAASMVAAAARERGLHLYEAEPASNLRRAAYLAELGRRGAEQGGADCSGNVRPLYLRPSSAEESRGAERE